jgi:hypothetical protein
LIAELRNIEIDSLYVVIDGPRPSHPGDRALVAEVADLFRKIDWVSDLHVIERNTNLGCGGSPRAAINQVFQEHEMLIILEDDCLPNKDFFPWANRLLKAFDEDRRVGAICGFQPCPANIVSQHDLFWASNLFAGWGWATWRRSWFGYQSDLANWREKVSTFALWQAGSSMAGARWFRANWDWVADRQDDIWDHQFGFLMASRGQVALKPPVNLIENIGTNERATHTFSQSSMRDLTPRRSLPTTGARWGSLKVNRKADRWILKHHYQAQPTIDWLGDLLRAGLRRATGWAS